MTITNEQLRSRATTLLGAYVRKHGGLLHTDAFKAHTEATLEQLTIHRDTLVVLETARRKHLYVEDTWYCCAAHPDYSGPVDDTECDCGADAVNAVIDQQIAKLREVLGVK